MGKWKPKLDHISYSLPPSLPLHLSLPLLSFSTCREMLVYKEGDQIYHSKMLTFYRKEPFDLEASYASPEHLPFPYTDIGK